MKNQYLDEQQQLGLLHEVMGITDENQFDDITLGATRDPVSGRLLTLDGAEASDVGLTVKFTSEPVLNRLKSYQASKEATEATGTKVQKNVYDDNVLIHLIPGGQKSRNLIVVAPMDSYYAWRFAKDYEAYKAGRSAVQSGTPVGSVPMVTPALAKELEQLNVFTVEQLAALPDSNASSIRSFQALKRAAKEFLATLKDTAAATQLHFELASRDAQIAALQEQMAKLLSVTKEDGDISEEKPAPKMRFGKPVKQA